MIDGDRLLTNLHALRDFGRHGNGVVRRCLDDADMAARHWLAERMTAAGLEAGIDGVANLLGVSPNPGPALLLGIGRFTDLSPEPALDEGVKLGKDVIGIGTHARSRMGKLSQCHGCDTRPSCLIRKTRLSPKITISSGQGALGH